MSTSPNGLPTTTTPGFTLSSKRVEFSSMRDTVTTVRTNRTIIIMSSRSHRGRNSLIYTTRFTAPTVVGFVTQRTQKLVYLTVANSHLSRLGLPPVIRRGASARRATFAIDVGTITPTKSPDTTSTRKQSHAVRSTVSPTAAPSSLGHPKRVFPLETESNKILRHPNRARTTMSLTHLTKLCPTKMVYRVRGPSNSVTQLPRLIACTHRRKLGLVDVTTLMRCHLQQRLAIAQRTVTRLPARFKRFRVCNCHDELSNSRTITVIGNSPDAFTSRAVLAQVRSRYLANRTLNSLHYSYHSRLRKTLRRVRRINRNIIICLHRRKQNVNLIGGLGTCSLRSRKFSAVTTGRTLKFRASLHSFNVKTRVLGSLNIYHLHLLAGGPDGLRRLRG